MFCLLLEGGGFQKQFKNILYNMPAVTPVTHQMPIQFGQKTLSDEAMLLAVGHQLGQSRDEQSVHGKLWGPYHHHHGPEGILGNSRSHDQCIRKCQPIPEQHTHTHTYTYIHTHTHTHTYTQRTHTQHRHTAHTHTLD